MLLLPLGQPVVSSSSPSDAKQILCDEITKSMATIIRVYKESLDILIR